MTDRPPEPRRHPSDLPDDRAEQLVAAAFAAFAEQHRDRPAGPGMAAVFAAAQARRRRRTYLSGLAAAAVLVLAVGMTALLTVFDEPENRPSADHQPPMSRPPVTSAPPTTSATPSDTPHTSRRRTSAPKIQDVDLRNTAVKVGPMRDENTCAGGVLRFLGGQASDPAGCSWRIAHGDVRYANIDGRAGDEVVTTISAGPPNAEYTDAVIAFRASGDGDLETMNYVFVAEHAFQGVRGISIGDDGRIVVEIEDSSWDPQQPQRQARAYRWTGAAVAFEQVSGPTAFPSPRPEPSQTGAPSSPSPAGE